MKHIDELGCNRERPLQHHLHISFHDMGPNHQASSRGSVSNSVEIPQTHTNIAYGFPSFHKMTPTPNNATRASAQMFTHEKYRVSPENSKRLRFVTRCTNMNKSVTLDKVNSCCESSVKRGEQPFMYLQLQLTRQRLISSFSLSLTPSFFVLSVFMLQRFHSTFSFHFSVIFPLSSTYDEQKLFLAHSWKRKKRVDDGVYFFSTIFFIITLV